MPGRNLHGGSGIVQTDAAEMQKAADAADISVLFFQLVLIFGPFWVVFGPFWQFGVIFGLFWVILGHFWAIFGANFLLQICLCSIQITFCNSVAS